MLRLHKVCAGYGEKEILHGIDLHVNPGEVTVVVGPNGCGKSTFLKTLAGLVELQSGEISVNERNLQSYRGAELAQQIAYLPQNRNVPDITVLRMVLHGRFPYLRYPRRYKSTDIQIAKNALRQVGLETYEECTVSTLSGGTQQKVYIAMALAQDTPVILMDEPTTYLDIAHQKKMMQMTRKLAIEGKAVILVLHDIAMALRWADRIVVMSDGKIEITGTPEQVYQSYVLNQVFGITVKRVQTEDGWQYYMI